MKRNRKNSIKKERIIMIASSAFVLTALTLTGLYMKEGNVESKDEGYTVDFTALEDKQNEYQEIARSGETNGFQSTPAPEAIEQNGLNAQVTEDDLDYMPMEAGSSLVEIPGLTDESAQIPGEESKPQEENAEEAEAEGEQKKEESASEKVIVTKDLSFSEGDGLTRPVSGEVLLPYSMDASIYFATLDQYKYNPAVMFSAQQGSSVLACAEGKVIDIFENEEIGHAVTLELGNGYQATYGQLEGIQVTLNSYVNPGETIATVAAPTKYFSAEGSNLYFELTKDGSPVNPENLF